MSRRARLVPATLAAAACLAATCLAEVAAAGGEDWRRIEVPPALSFPADHGAHPEVRTEWWYLTALLETAAGERFGVQLTFFRQGLDPAPPAPGASRLRARQVLAAHLAVASVGTGGFRTAERLRRDDGLLAGAAVGDLEVRLDGWRLERGEGDVLEAAAVDRDGGVELGLRLVPERPLVAHGEGGLSAKGPEPGNASVYVSWTRLAASGELVVDGRRLAVTGKAWFDHEWGTSQLGEGVVGWDWFSLRLDDGRDLMVYRLRRGDGSADPHSSGTLVDADGAVRRLGADEVRLEATGEWASPVSGGRYPAGWRLEVPSAGIELELRPLVAAAEVDGRGSTGVVYWEGPVAAVGTPGGEGYVELTGYAGTLAGRF